MAAATCATAATTVRATARVAASNRAAFCTGARLRPAAAAARVPAARGREMMVRRR